MPVLTRCPPPARLLDLVNGLAGPTEEADLLAHLDGCSGCQRQLDQLMGASSDLLTVARQVGHRSRQEDACWQQLRAHLEGKTLLIAEDEAVTSWSAAGPGVLEALNTLEGYEIKRPLGEGGMGLVFEATERALRRSVAIKILSPRLAGDAVARQRFAREAQAAAAVHHPHVVTIHSVSTVAGLPYLVMEYCAGGSLQDWLDRYEPLRVNGPGDSLTPHRSERDYWQAVARLGEQIASGLAAAHARGLVHRDIKPSNILLQTEGWPHVPSPARIGDFGLAQVADESRLTETGQVAGTPMYMAPEQALGGSLDGRADLFSLGSVLYTLCTGQEPFPGGSPLVILRQVCETTPRPVRQLEPSIPPWLAALITRLHARQPADRFASAAEVAELIRYNLQHPESPRVVPPPRTDRSSLWKRFGLIALAVVGGLLLAGGLLPGDHSRSSPPATAPAEEKPAPLVARATLGGHSGPVWAIALSPDGHTVVTGSDGDETTLRGWDAVTGQEKQNLAVPGAAIQALAFMHKGQVLVSGGGDGAIRSRDAVTWREIRTLEHLSGNMRRAAFGPEDLLAVPGNNGQSVEVWDLTTGKLRHTVARNHATISALAFSPNGHVLATSDVRGQIYLWNADTGAELSHFSGEALGVRALAFAPDGLVLASAGSGGKDVSLWEVPSGRPVAVLPSHDAGIVSMAFSPRGRRLALGDREGSVQILSVRSGRRLAQQRAHAGFVWAVAFSPDGNTLATAGEDHLAHLWDLTDLPADRD